MIPLIHVVREEPALSLKARIERNAHKPAVIWLTGLPGAGKSTIGRKLESALFATVFVRISWTECGIKQ